MKKVIVVFGTRPEAIKMAPLIKKLQQDDQFNIVSCVTAQHREMLDMVLELFDIKPDYDLNLMHKKQTLTDINVRVLKAMEKIYTIEKPDIVLVHGDTTTTMAAALAAFYQKLSVGHVEAGLRTFNIYSPFPEEMNRRITGTIASLHFAPTVGNKNNLINSGIKEEKIFVTGNTVIDAVHMIVQPDYLFKCTSLKKIDFISKRIIVLTAHRRENIGDPMRNIFRAVKRILNDNSDVECIYPVHMNPKVKSIADEIFGNTPGISLIPPLGYDSFINLVAKSHLVLTDSGGLQEEAPALGKPVIVLRKETERPEAVDAGTVRIAGVDENDIYEMIQKLLNDNKEYKKMARAVNPYGDGRAAERILEVIKSV